MGHREEKKRATREAIRDAALDLVEERGLARTTVEAISERAGVAPRTFWAYFSSKEDAVIGRDPERVGDMGEELLARPEKEQPLTALRQVLESDLRARTVDLGRSLRRQRIIRQEPALMAAAAAYFDEMERALVAAVGSRLKLDPARHLLPGVLVAAASGACRVAYQHWGDGHEREALAELIDRAFADLAGGIALLGRPGRQLEGTGR